MFKYAIQLIFCAILAISSCGKKSTTEKEPNNNYNNAQDLSLNSSVEGTIGNEQDIDIYRVDVLEDQIVSISVSGIKGVNHAVKVMHGQSTPKLVKIIDDRRKSSPESFANMYLPAGTSFIIVTHGDRDVPKANNESSYKLTISSEKPFNEEREPNDLSIQATSISPGTALTGYFSPAYNKLSQLQAQKLREEDWYTFDVTIESGISKILSAEVSAVKGINSQIYLYDSEMHLIAQTDAGITGKGETLSGVGISNSGTYYLMVTTKGYHSNHEDPYALYVSTVDAQQDMELEPNNNYSQVNIITGAKMQGAINVPGDKDIFKFNVEKTGGTYRLECIPDGDMDPRIVIYDSMRNELIRIDNLGKGSREILPAYDFTSDFYIHVEDRSGIIDIKPTYELNITPVLQDEEMEREPNNTIALATKIKGDKVKGFTTVQRDKDYFLLNYDSRKRLRIEIQGVEDGSLKISITDPMGYILKSIDVKGDSLQIINETIDRKGYIIVESVKENYLEPYTIKISEN